MDARTPDIEQLVAAALDVALAMHGERPPDDELETLLRDLLFGERDLWKAVREGLITELELRDALLARTASRISYLLCVDEPSADLWVTRDLERAFEIALFGREAQRK